MASSLDMSGLPLLESAIGAMQVQQAAAPASFTGGQSFSCTYPAAGAATGTAPPTMTVAQLIQRLQNSFPWPVDALPPPPTPAQAIGLDAWAGRFTWIAGHVDNVR